MKMLQNVTLIFFFNLIVMFSTGKCVSPCIYKAVGDKVVIPFDGAKLQDNDELRWTHNQKRVLKKGTQDKHSKLNVDQHGSLILENVQKDKSGKYQGVVYGKNGNLIKETVQQLCVQEPVSEPTVMFECIEKAVSLTCSPMNNTEVVVWMKNGMKVNAAGSILHVSSSELKYGDKFSCTVSNQISKKSAKEVKPVCSDTGMHTTNANKDKGEDVNSNSGNENTIDAPKKKFLFGLDLSWMLVILIGGGGFLLILFIICLVCVCRCSRRNKRKAKEEEEYRLTSLMPDHTNQPDEQYLQTTTQRSSKSQRPLPPLPSPQGPPSVGLTYENNQAF